MASTRLSMQSVVVRSARIFSQDLDEDVIMLDMERGDYFATEGVGKFIWDALKESTSIAEVCKQIEAAFSEVDTSTCVRDTLEFLAELAEADLIEARDE